MRILELFSGTASFSNIAKERGHNVFTIDNQKKFNPDLCKNIIKVEANEIIKKFGFPDMIWASPPCTRFSIANHRHWNNQEPNPDTIRDIDLIHHTLKIIFRLHPKFWILENPKGRLRWILGNPPNTVYYGSYGHPVLKPTDLWGFYPKINFKKKPNKKLGKWSYDIQRDAKNKGVIPAELCNQIIKQLENNLDQNPPLKTPNNLQRENQQ